MSHNDAIRKGLAMADAGYDVRFRCNDVEAMLAENERLREALAKYADPNYNGYNGGPEHAARILEQDMSK